MGALSNVGNPGPAGRTAALVEAPTTSYGAPIHTGFGSPISQGIQVARAPKPWQDLQNRVSIYNDAAQKWNQSAQTPSIGNLINKVAPLGLSMQAPDINRPSTFSGGDYHLGWNPGSLLGLAGMAVPGLGSLTGSLGQAAYTAAGLPNAIIGGQGSMGMPNWSKANGFGQMVAGIPQSSGIGAPGAPGPTGPMTANAGGVPWLSALAQKKPSLGQMIGG